ncbi:unnamed protein product, partial [Gongylonema pulchrum]|uniref:WD_REPEATS_REGION domain-containing protein n=1 Tax=Gongylonema pulchrum TaxID=637853 RepID=A0A183F0D6_9BILA
CVARLGQKGNFFVVAAKNKPLLHVLSANSRKRFHVKSVLPKPLHHLAITPDGTVLFAAVGNQIRTWMIATGEFVSIVNAHYCAITNLVLSSDGSLLVSGTEDGSLCVFIVAE